MAGLLDWLQTPTGIGLLSTAAGAMAGARRGQPWNTAGRGLVSGLTGYGAAQDQLRADEENAFAKQYKTMQMDQMKAQMSDAQRKIEEQQKQRQWREGLPGMMSKAQTKATPFEADNPFGEDLGRLANVQQGDPAALQDYLMQPDSPYADKLIEQQIIPKAPKWNVVERYNAETGMPEKVLMDENNPSDIRPFGGAQADTVVADNLGGSLVYRGSRSATPIAQAQRTATPDALMSSQTSMRGQDLSAATTRRGQDINNANAAASRAVSIRGQDLPPKASKGGPMSVTLQKELLESDDTAQGSKSVINTLNSALLLNKDAYSGYAAKPRAVLRSNLPFQSKAADATIAVDNMMTGQALESLKLIFGGMPTEGERKILLEMQASVDKTPAQREAIMNRAKAAAKRRGEYASRKAAAIRNGTYLTDGIPQPSEQPDAPAGGVKFLGFE